MRILITDGMDKAAMAQLRELGHEVVEQFYEPDQLGAALRDFDAVVVRSKTKVRANHIDEAKGGKLKLIIRGGVGVDNIDVKYAEENGIAVRNTPGASSQSVAELAMGHMFACTRYISIAGHTMREGKWEKKAYGKGIELQGKTLGIIGFGRIGQSVARKAQAFDMEVIAYDPFLPPAIAENLGVKLVDFDTLLAESDVLSLHMNLTEENYHMFNKEAFMKCKKHPIIVNEGRGPLICDEDLVWALDNGYIRGAALDMVESEDPDLDTCPLVGRDDVLLTPHSGYYSDTSNYLVAKLSMDNALYYVNGEYDKVKSIRNGVNA